MRDYASVRSIACLSEATLLFLRIRVYAGLALVAKDCRLPVAFRARFTSIATLSPTSTRIHASHTAKSLAAASLLEAMETTALIKSIFSSCVKRGWSHSYPCVAHSEKPCCRLPAGGHGNSCSHQMHFLFLRQARMVPDYPP